MTGWIIAALLAAAGFAAIVLVLRAPRGGREAIGAALLVGLAGYGLQSHPGLAGAPAPPEPAMAGDPAAAIALRQAFAGQTAPPADSYVLTADAFARHGQYADAAGVLLGAIDKRPDDGEAWLALGNALVGHAEGTLTPAALYAYRHAAVATPDQPGPPFFLGLALAQSGRFDEARSAWAGLLARSPADAPWRGAVAERLQRLDMLIAMRDRQAHAQP